MSRHPLSYEVERPVSANEAAPGLQSATVGEIGNESIGPAEEPLKETAKTSSPEKPAGTATPAPPQASAKRRLRPLLAAAVGTVLILGGAYYGWEYWTVGRFEQSTDDAYIRADSTTIAPKVSGYLAEVLVSDNERVKAGQLLAHIDDRDFRAALQQATADVAAAKAAVSSKQAMIDVQGSAIDTAKATLELDRANQTFAEQEDKRYSTLAKTGFGSVQNAEQASSRIAAARASVQRDTASVASAIKQVDLLKADLAQAEATVLRAQATQRQAELNLSYTNIVSPVDGDVGNRTLRVGQFVQAGTQLMAVVPTDKSYVVANFKETQLTDVRKGQPVSIEVDTFPGKVAHGHVDSISPAAGQEFALLPPDNATGNFTKIVQRIPVKITFDANSPLVGDLRAGMSVTPTIQTNLHD